jgi:hypothetical protein
MKKMVFTIASRRLEVDLEDKFAQYVAQDWFKNNLALDGDNEISQLLQLYLKSMHREFTAKEQTKTELNNKEESNES